MFRTILCMKDKEVEHFALKAYRMVRKMEFQCSTLPELSTDHSFLYSFEGAKFALAIAEQRACDIGKPAYEREQNLRGLCAMLEIEHYQDMPAIEDMPTLKELGIEF